MRTSRSFRRARAVLIEACEARQHMAVDLVATAMSSDDPLMPLMYHPQDYAVTVINAGTSSIPDSTGVVVTLYSVDDLNDPSPKYIGAQTIWGWGAFQSKTLSFRTTPYYRSDNEGYVIAEIDSQNAVAETNETNNKHRGLGIDMLQYSMEADVTSPSGGVKARPLSLFGQFADGFIGDESMAGVDVDTYAATLTAGKTYWFEMYEVDQDINLAMRLFGPNLNHITTSTSDPLIRGERGAYIEYTPTVTGEYYIAINSHWNLNGSITNLTDRAGYLESGAFKIAAAEKDYSTIQISSMDPAAVEGSPGDPSSGLEFKVTRNWGNQWWRPLKVELSNSGMFNGDLADAIPTTVTIPAHQPSVTFRTMPVQDALNELTETHHVSIASSAGNYVVGQYHTQALTILDNPATHQPFAMSQAYVGHDRPGPRTFIQFSEDVGYSISKDDYTLKNLDTGAVVPVSNFQVLWSASVNASIVYFTGFPNGQLPDGRYRMTLSKNSVYTVPDVRRLANDVVVEFTSLNGDANGDARVDFADLLTVSQNYGNDYQWDGGAQYGDFDRNGKVEFGDLLTLSQNYGRNYAGLFATSPILETPAKRRRPGL